jgi:hypothetical protein
MISWEQLRDYFERDGIHFSEQDGRLKVLEADMLLSGIQLQLRVVYDDQHNVLSFVVPNCPLPKRLPRNRHELRRALLLLNACYILGCFTENPQGRVSFEITVPIEGNEVPYPVYRRLLAAALGSVDRALPWLKQVALGAMSAEEAVENIAELSQPLGEPHLESAVSDPEDDPGLGAITEREIEDFGRSLLEGNIPPPVE